MERRQALKNLGFGSAAVLVSTTFLGALQGCAKAPTVDWVPVYLTPEEAAQLEKICEAIVPKTDTPGATEAGVAQYMDQALSVLYKDKEADYFKKGMAVFVKNFDDKQDVKFDKASTQQVTDVINGYFQNYDADRSIMDTYRKEFGKDGEKSDQFVETYFVNNVVGGAFRAYFTSELVGETVMPYDPIPTKYEGCLPYKEGQKSWASV